MPAIDSLQVILELNDGNFTTRVVRAGQQLASLSSAANVTVKSVDNLTSSLSHGSAGLVGWTIALGEARHAVHTLHAVFGSWIEKIISVNSHIEQTVAMMAGFSTAATQAERLAEGMRNVQAAMQLAANTPFRLDSIHDVFVKLRVAGLDPLGGSIRSLSDAVAAFGGNDEKFKHAAYAIQDMAGKGVISMEELRRQLGQHIPNAMPLMARAMNLTVQELIAAVTKGTLESKNAIQQLFAEFDRTFSGQAAERMLTLSGALAQLTTSFMHLGQVAGGTQIDAPAGTSSYKTLIDGVSKFNDAMMSPELQGAAVRVNMMLKSVMDGVNGLIPILPILADNLGLIGKAFEVLAAIIAAKMIGGLLSVLGSMFVSVMSGAGYLVGGLRSIAVAIPSMVAAIPAAAAAVAAFGSTVALNLGIIGAAVTGASGGLAALAAGFAVVSVPTAILAGLGLLIYKFSQVKGAAEETGEALQRLAQGDYTPKTITQAKEELQALRDKLELLKKNKAAMDEIAAGRSSQYKLRDIGGFLDTPDINSFTKANEVNVNRPGLKLTSPQIQAQFDPIRREITSAIDSIQKEIDRVSDNITQAPTRVAEMRANRLVVEFQRNMASAMQVLNREFDDRATTIADLRKEVSSLPPDKRAGATGSLNQLNQDATRERYAKELALFDEKLARERDKLKASLDARNDIMAAAQTIEIDRLEKIRADRKAEIDSALENSGLVKTIDQNKLYEKQLSESGKEIQNFIARNAQLSDQLNGVAGNLARVKAELSAGGKFELVGVNSETGKHLLELAEATDRLIEANKRFKAANVAEEKLNNGFSKAQADLEGYLLKLTDPQMPEAQRTFVIMQRQMEHAFKSFTENMDYSKVESYATVLMLLNQKATTLSNTMASITLSGIESRDIMLQSRLNASLDPIKKSAAIKEQTLDAIAKDRKAIEDSSALNDEERLAALARLDKQKNLANTISWNTDAKTGARASAPADGAVTQLKGRLAELQAQTAETGSEYSRWLAMLNAPESRGKYSGQREQILQLASAIDGMKDKVKLANEAQRALDAIRHDSDHADNEVMLTQRILKTGKLLDIERELLKYSTLQEDHLSRIAKRPAAPKDGSRDVVLDNARAEADDNIQDKGYGILLKKIEANRTLTNTIKFGFADTLAARRQAGLEEISWEQQHLIDFVRLYAKSIDERKAMEDDVSSYILARREEVERKTENGLSRLGREWRDTSAQLADFGAQATTKFVDDLAEKLATGKGSWTDFANWAIKELIRIQLRSALAPLAKAGGEGLSKLIGLAGTAIGAALGLGDEVPDAIEMPVNAPIGNVQPNGAGSMFDMIGHNHTGGIAGSESSFSRMLPMSMFHNAPRFHGGTGPLKYGEVASVLQMGEGVFTAGQMAAIGKLNYNYDFVQTALTALISSMREVSKPDIAPVANYSSAIMDSVAAMAKAPATQQDKRNDYDRSGSFSKAPVPVTINVQNSSSQPISAVASLPKFDGEQMIIDVVIRNINQPGPLRNAFRDAR